MDKLILASGSPRRQELLKQMGLKFETYPQDVDEAFAGGTAEEEAVIIAEKKTASYLASDQHGQSEWVLGADTFVVLDGSFMGKPGDRGEAREMLKLLSGRTHQVITGLALHVPEKGIKTAFSVTDVSFSKLSADEIEWYLDQGEWRGVAAAYRIQEKAAVFISKLTGSYSNVMGLPINAFYGMLMSDKFNFRA